MGELRSKDRLIRDLQEAVDKLYEMGFDDLSDTVEEARAVILNPGLYDDRTDNS